MLEEVLRKDIGFGENKLKTEYYRKIGSKNVVLHPSEPYGMLTWQCILEKSLPNNGLNFWLTYFQINDKGQLNQDVLKVMFKDYVENEDEEKQKRKTFEDCYIGMFEWDKIWELLFFSMLLYIFEGIIDIELGIKCFVTLFCILSHPQANFKTRSSWKWKMQSSKFKLQFNFNFTSMLYICLKKL